MQLAHEIVRFTGQDREGVDHFATGLVRPVFP